MHKHIFRPYDIRGIYPTDLNEEIAYKVARALVELYPHSKKLVLARDSRLSSPNLAEAVRSGLIDSGVDVIDLGLAPDPLFYFALKYYHFDGGIVVSGSHNPKEYNGLNIDIRLSADKETEGVVLDNLEKIKKRVFEERPFEKKDKLGNVINKDLSEEYINYVSKRIKLKKPLKIIIDVGNGACGLLPEKMFKKLGCEVTTLFAEPDGNFPNHIPDPYKEENVKEIEKTVLKEKADVGFAFDTDGDRVAPIDDKGRVVSGDFCLTMLARESLEKKKGPIVHCMRAPQALLDEMKEKDVKTHFSVSFHTAVSQKIIEKNAVFGGEVTHHYFFPLDYYLVDEALFAALKLAEIASKHESFADYIDSLPRYHASHEVFVTTPDNQKTEIINKLQQYLRDNNYNFIDIDGARIIFPNGWALARQSNTSPFIKCRFEGRSKEDLITIEKECLDIFEKVGIPITKETYTELGLKK